MELVDVEIEISLLGCRNLLPSHRHLLKFRDQEGAEKIGVLLSNGSLCNFAFFNSSFLREPDFPICLELGSHAGPF